MQPSVLQRKIKKKRTCLGGRGQKKKPHLAARIGWLWCFVLETGNHIVYLAQESRRHSRRRRRKRNVSIIREWRREERRGREGEEETNCQLATGNALMSLFMMTMMTQANERRIVHVAPQRESLIYARRWSLILARRAHAIQERGRQRESERGRERTTVIAAARAKC